MLISLEILVVAFPVHLKIMINALTKKPLHLGEASY